jgi:hypothetical protein
VYLKRKLSIWGFTLREFPHDDRYTIASVNILLKWEAPHLFRCLHFVKLHWRLQQRF